MTTDVVWTAIGTWLQREPCGRGCEHNQDCAPPQPAAAATRNHGSQGCGRCGVCLSRAAWSDGMAVNRKKMNAGNRIPADRHSTVSHALPHYGCYRSSCGYIQRKKSTDHAATAAPTPMANCRAVPSTGPERLVAAPN